MKVFLLFKLKDVKTRKKEWIVDSLYLTEEAAFTRALRLLGFAGTQDGTWQAIEYALKQKDIKTHPTSILRGPSKQQCYIINKSLKGQLRRSK